MWQLEFNSMSIVEYAWSYPGFRVKPYARETGHWQGGAVQHKGAQCKACKRPLMLLWEFDCTVPELHGKFKSLKRLPLYYCPRCSCELSYSIEGESKIHIHRCRGEVQSSDFPYRDYPEYFLRRSIELEEIPNKVEKLLWLAHYVWGPDLFLIKECSWFTPGDRAILNEWIGWEFQDRGQLHCDQFLGLPYLIQGRQKTRCPNRRCGSREMKILATIWSNTCDGSLPLWEPSGANDNHWVQVVFHICEGCYAIHVCNQQD